MKAYVITSGFIFGLLTIAHIVRAIVEHRMVTDPLFIVITLLSAALTFWAWRVLRRLSQ